MQFDRLTPGFQRNVLPPFLFPTMCHIPEACFHAWTSANIHSFTYCPCISFYPYISLFSFPYFLFFSYFISLCIFSVFVLFTSVDPPPYCLLSFLYSYLMFFLRHFVFIFSLLVTLFSDLLYFHSFHLLLEYCICYNCLLTFCYFVSSYTTNPTSFVLT
jgi:hypothetical protein